MDATPPGDVSDVAQFRTLLIESLGRGSPAMFALSPTGEALGWNRAFEIMVDSEEHPAHVLDLLHNAVDSHWEQRRATPPGATAEEACACADFFAQGVRYRLRCMEMAAGLLDDDPVALVTMERLASDSSHCDSPESPFELTPREAEVAALIAKGWSNKAIAAHLEISSHTARHHTARVLSKLSVTSRAAAAAVLNR